MAAALRNSSADGGVGAAESAPFVQRHIIQIAIRAFDDFAGSGVDRDTNRRLLGIS